MRKKTTQRTYDVGAIEVGDTVVDGSLVDVTGGAGGVNGLEVVGVVVTGGGRDWVGGVVTGGDVGGVLVVVGVVGTGSEGSTVGDGGGPSSPSSGKGLEVVGMGG